MACSIVELRQYVLRPGGRDVLIELFDREFVEAQEALGMRVIGQFRDAHEPNRFVWLRGFDSMETRLAGLKAFYGGPVWKAHRDAANATMIDSDNVLLLKPAHPGSGFAIDGLERGLLARATTNDRRYVAHAYGFREPVERDFAAYFERTIRPKLERDGIGAIARFVSERGANTFPALPVREAANAFVWFGTLPAGGASLEASDVPEPFADLLKRPVETMTLSPTPRSLLH